MVDSNDAPHRSASVEAERSVRIERDGGEQRLVATQRVPRPRDEVFPYFADARNLEQLTPPFLRFRILEVSTPDVRQDTRIRYRLRLHGVPVGWHTVILEWEPPLGFTDYQRRGPFRLWRHRHDFIEVDGGTLLRDTVHFAIYGSALLPEAATRWVDRDLRQIFNYRQDVIAARFGRLLPSSSTSADGPRTSQTTPSVFRSTTT